VNLEADLLAKYTERLLRAGPAAAPHPSAAGEGTISAAWLAERGWG
jgi:riboflavin synthase